MAHTNRGRTGLRLRNPRQTQGLTVFCAFVDRTGAFTLVEMLVAMAITLVMMGAVVTLFANISSSVRNRRATTEMSGQLRHVRNVLQQDLRGATCPGTTWQRPESNHGYIEIIEGEFREGYASLLLDAKPNAPPPESKNLASQSNPEIDHFLSTLPASNLAFNEPTWATDGGALGDFDDILMLTSRNEHEPFVGRAPAKVRPSSLAADTFDKWGYETVQSPLAEVIWYAVENPGYTDAASSDPDPAGKHFFGEPGYRTIYRRTLLIAPWLNPYRYVDSLGKVTDTFAYDGGTFKAQPGLMRILPKKIVLANALAAMVAFQDRYDLSVRLEWDDSIQRWKVMANTLGDLTKRENRFEHFGYRPVETPGGIRPVGREFPYPFISKGSGWPISNVVLLTDPDPNLAPTTVAIASAPPWPDRDIFRVSDPGAGYKVRPFAFLNSDSMVPLTVRAMLNDEGQVVRLTFGPAPLWGERRGEDVMMTDVLAWDLRVWDPGAPIFVTRKVPESTTDFSLDVVLTPSDPGWRGSPPKGTGGAYFDDIDNFHVDGLGRIGNNNKHFQYVGQGAYVDMGYGYDKDFLTDYLHYPFPFFPPGGPLFPWPKYAPAYVSSIDPWFFWPSQLKDVYGASLAPGYNVYDTWSFHYENNGLNEDGYWYQGPWHRFDPTTNAWKSVAPPGNDWRRAVDSAVDGRDNNGQLGIDDVRERETAPPYDKPLRGLEVTIRAYERDSRAIRQVRVHQHFMQE